MATISSTNILAVGENERDSVARPQSLRLRFAKDVLLFGWANVICLALNATLTFLLPRYLTIEDFGYYRLFILYASLAGVIHLGLLDGILVRWAEKPDERIGSEIRDVLAFLVVQQIVFLFPASVVFAYWFRTSQWVWLGFGLAVYVAVFNCSTLAQFALQARKQFAQLSFFTVAITASLLVFVVGWKVLGHLNALTAMASYVAANLLAGIGVWSVALKGGTAPVRASHSIRTLGLGNIRLGWKILVANSLLTLIPSLDRFFVSGAFSIRDFAIYAFAGNTLAVVYTIAISVARVVYPYLSEGTNLDTRKRGYNLGRTTLLSLWALSLTLYFPTAMLVHWLLPKYVSSLAVARLLMINSGFIAMIHILHANYFRVNLALNRFLAGSFAGLTAAAALLALARHTANLQWIAGAMTAAVVIWWAADEVLLAGDVGVGWRESGRILVLWVLSSVVFLGACTIGNLWLGGLTYFLACVVLLALGLRNTIASLFAIVLSLFSRPKPCLEVL